MPIDIDIQNAICRVESRLTPETSQEFQLTDDQLPISESAHCFSLILELLARLVSYYLEDLLWMPSLQRRCALTKAANLSLTDEVFVAV